VVLIWSRLGQRDQTIMLIKQRELKRLRFNAVSVAKICP
jgi:hypothetical protein